MNENQNKYVDINAHDNYPDSEQKIEIPTMKVIPLKKICMTIGELPTSYLETMTYYEMLVWFINFLRDNIIPTVNGNGEAVEELQNVVMSLQNYINKYKDLIDSDVEELEDYMNNYFENLDVQEEINNKLDEMLKDGVLEQIIEQFLQLTSLICFDNVADMKSSVNLANGSYAKTLGYHSKNDGGGATYKIRKITNDDIVDESFIIALNDNTLIAELIIENNTINIRQLGASENNDISHYITKYLNKNKNRINLYIPSGNWLCSETILDKWFSIVGDSKFVGKTIIYPNVANQQYIFRLDGISCWNMEYLHFETLSNKPVSNAILKLYKANYGNLNYLTFQNVIGECIDLENSFEINILKTIARHIIPIALGENYGVFKISSSDGEIPSTIYFDYIQLEKELKGNVFIFNSNSAFFIIII